ncbi:hypothetical protein BHU72_05165 [Desulfuribacillus stibiiarsenatis]|uniref:O-antigen ligase-related domain-containing protein n=1 Tax=Desulfuribacillus stibiiarsenatis TaxID=1390249 RepID=A0A1E5L5Q5_9FIRM|nr:O-antigen ligase family protein [Desulfuribacillus stibiiarsenatis]OEH85477.1 hypothetical protein BHU72_05165 [Desulfuribacillus stibiiarsenatis]
MNFNNGKKQKKRELHNGLNVLDWYYLIPLALIGAFVPTIVYLKITELPPHIAAHWVSSENLDFFSYYKSLWIQIISGLSIIILVLARIQNTFRFRNEIIYYPLFLYAGMIILSTIFTDPIYMDVALKGFPDRFEGMWVLLSYIVITIVTMNIVNQSSHFKILLGSLLVSASILSILGIFQFFGTDFFQTDIGKALILPNQYKYMSDTLSFTFGPHTIYSTFYNTNYVGSYMSMVFILSIVLYLFAKERNYQIVLGIVICLTFSNLIGSNSRAGLMGGVIAFLVLFIVMYRVIIEKWKQSIILAFSLCLIFFGLNTISDGGLTSNIERLTSEQNNLITDNIKDESNEGKISLDFKDLSLDKNRAILDMGQQILTVEALRVDNSMEYNHEDYKFYDTEGKTLPYTFNKELYELSFDDANYSKYTLIIAGNLVQINYNTSLSISLGTGPDGKIYFVNNKNQLVQLNTAPSWGFEGRETMGSSRGYLWSRSIPMLKETVLLGKGPDTYAIYFPQDDYIAKRKYLSEFYRLVDKPHNIYLQQGINTGVISLIAFLSIFFIYFYSCFRLYFKKNINGENIFNVVGIASFLAVISYAVTGIFNDSVVSVAPVFWLILGIGLASNRINKENIIQT